MPLFRRRLAVPAFIATCAVVVVLGAPRIANAGTDNVQLVEDFFDEVNAGDTNGALALVSDDFKLTDINGGSFAVVGKPAFESVLAEVDDLDTVITVTDIDAEGSSTVTGTAEFSDDDSDDAGVDRYIQDFTFLISGDEITLAGVRLRRE